MLVAAVGVALDQHLASCLVRVFLVGNAQLVISDDLGVGDLLKVGRAAEMLGHQSRVTKDVGVRDHGDEVVSRHGFPELVQERAVVDSNGGSDDFPQTSPVLRVQRCELDFPRTEALKRE